MPAPDTGSEQFETLATKGSETVQQAAAVLEKELSASLVDAHKLGKSLADDRRVDNESLDKLIDRFRATAHQLIDVAGGRFDDLRSGEVQELTERFSHDAREAVDAFADLLGLAPDILNRLTSLATSKAGEEPPSQSS